MYRELKAEDLPNIRELLKQKPTLLLIHAKWCGACKMYLPEWKKFARKVKESDEFQLLAIEDSVFKQLPAKDYKFLAGKEDMYYPKLAVYRTTAKGTLKRTLYEGDRSPEALLELIGKAPKPAKAPKARLPKAMEDMLERYLHL